MMFFRVESKIQLIALSMFLFNCFLVFLCSVSSEHVPENWDDMVVGRWYDLIDVSERMPFQVKCDPRIPGRMYCLLASNSFYQPAISNDYGNTWTVWDDGLGVYSSRILGNVWFENRFTQNGSATFYFVASVFDTELEEPIFRIFLADEAGTAWREVCHIRKEGFANSISAFSVAPNGTMIFGSNLPYPPGGSGLCLSSDNGENWQTVWTFMDGGVMFGDIKFSPIDPNIVIATLEYPGHLVYKSTDGGYTWVNTNFNEPGVHPQYGIETVVFHPTNPDVLFFIVTELFNMNCYIKMSYDGGNTWIDFGPCDPDDRLGISGMYIDPDDPNRILLFGTEEPGNVYLSTDGGNHWETILSGCEYDEGSRNSVTCVESPWEPDRLYLSAAGLKSSVDMGKTWLPIHPYDTDYATWSAEISYVDETDLQHMVFLQDYVGAFHSSDAGQTWLPSTINYHGWIFGYETYQRCLSSPLNRNYLYVIAGYDNQTLLRSSNYGATWDPLTIDSDYEVYLYTLSASVSGRIYAVLKNDEFTQSRVYRSEDFGDNWIFCSQLPDDHRAGTLRDCPSDPDLVLMTVEDKDKDKREGKLYRSIDAGINWDKTSNERGFKPTHSQIYGQSRDKILFHPHESNTVYASVSQTETFESTDRGLNWLLTQKWPISTRMRIHKHNDSLYFAEMELSKNKGLIWAQTGNVYFIPDLREDLLIGSDTEKSSLQVMRMNNEPPRIELAGYLNTHLETGCSSAISIAALVSTSSNDVDVDHCEVLYNSEPVGIYVGEDDDLPGVCLRVFTIVPAAPMNELFQLVPVDEFSNVGKPWPSLNVPQ